MRRFALLLALLGASAAQALPLDGRGPHPGEPRSGVSKEGEGDQQAKPPATAGAPPAIPPLCPLCTMGKANGVRLTDTLSPGLSDNHKMRDKRYLPA